MATRTRTIGLATVLAVAALALVGVSSMEAVVGDGAPSERARGERAAALPGFSGAVFLSHVNNPSRTPGFPGDPEFSLRTVFTVPEDGFYLQEIRQGEHTGTHYSAPCHFHVPARCANRLTPGDLILPAVVVDVREEVRRNPDYALTVQDLRDWTAEFGPMPSGAAVIARTGCDRYWGRRDAPTAATYYNCGSGLRGFHQPGFSEGAVRWLIRTGVLGRRGATGTDTFGPDPATDERFMESSLTLRRHRLTLENLTNLGQLPASGAWIVVGGPRNRRGSGAPSSIIGLVP